MTTKLNTAAILLTAGVALSTSILAQQTPAAKPATASSPTTTQKAAAKQPATLELKTAKEKGSYAIGANIGANIGSSLKRDGIDIDTAILLRGMKDALAGNKLLLTDDEIKTVITALQKEARENMAAKMKVEGEENKKAGEGFLAANKSKPGVTTLADGLQYKVLKQGDGPKPAATDTVECNYRGTLINGREFDSSAKHGNKPATFPVNGVIKGWTEVLQLMPVGSKYQVFIPEELAYGPRPSTEIGPNSALIFEIELVSIKEKPAAATPAPTAAKPAPATAKPAEPAK